MCFQPSHVCPTHLQDRSFGGSNQLGGFGKTPTVGCGIAPTRLVISPDPEPAEVARLQMNPPGCWPVNLTQDQ